ncbi:carbohydrate ABC transporter permease [Leifsonia poae]|uniref:Amino acid ABC transporter permease n=1 Tax=Leifsonia poae TaxID=110933 RepID=A0A9W6LZR3_9MICO|nr:sugar ABC transporter permease [Leifsonia poae]GLJ75914.1 amino acid ABC transporter permease [Leifsonia poae]
MTSTLDAVGSDARGRGGSPRPQRPERTARSRRMGRSVARAVPLVPAIGLLVVFLVGPILASFYGSFTNSSLTGSAAADTEWIGLKNYIDLFNSPDFPVAVVLTLVFVIGSAVIGQNVMGMVLALLMRHGGRVVGAIVSTFVVGAWVLPEIVAAFASYAFFSSKGTFNAILAAFGIAGPAWLFAFPMLAVILANTWRGAAFSMLVYSAALSEVPPEITEAAEVDGANGVKRFFLVTLPMIRRSISTNLMLITLQTLSVFTLIYVMTGGGPGNKSMTLPVLAYQEAFKFSELGYGTAIATILLLVGAIFAFVYVRALKSEVD